MTAIAEADRNRPDWQQYFLGLAFLASQRSHDAETQHGCVITDRHNRVLSMGYNDFPRKMNDSVLPRTRPDKYPWMCHSERNAIANLTISPFLIPGGAVAYVTGQPCNDCAHALWQSNVTTWYLATRQGTKLESDETRKRFDHFVADTGVEIHYVQPKLGWIMEAMDRLNK